MNFGIFHNFSHLSVSPITYLVLIQVNKTLLYVVETGLTLLAQSSVPQRFWHFAFDTIVYLINRMPSRTNKNISPFEHVFKHKPDFSFLSVFGCQCFPHLRPYNNHKMDFRSLPCVFLGYSTSHHGYRCFDPFSERLYIVRHFWFHQRSFPYNINPPTPPEPSSSNPYTSSYPTPDPSNIPTTPPPILPTTPPTSPISSTSPPSCKSPQCPPLVHTYHRRPRTTTSQLDTSLPQTAIPQPEATQSQPCVRPSNLRPNPKPTKPYDPTSYHTHTSSPDIEPTTFTIANKLPQWRQAMAEEYSALLRNNTWSLVPRVSNMNVVECKWVYKLKRDHTGAIVRYKARLVAKGFINNRVLTIMRLSVKL